jgi:drug/metabolite transporter (DMT)-like permease
VSVSGTISGVFVFSGITPMALIYGLIIGVFGTVLPALMLNEANGRIGPERTAVLGTTGPMATSVMAVWILGESFTVWHGGALVFCVAGVSLIMRSTQRF